MLMPSAATATEPMTRMPIKQPNPINSQRTSARSFLETLFEVTEFANTMLFTTDDFNLETAVGRGGVCGYGGAG